MTLTRISPEQEAAITSAGSARFGRALRESGLEGKSLGSLRGADAEAFRECVLAGVATERQMRESAGLIDLGGAGVPLVDGAPVGVPDEGAFIEPSEAEMRAGLLAAGVPMAGIRPSLRQRMDYAMRASGTPSRMREAVGALVDKAETIEALRAKQRAAGPIPFADQVPEDQKWDGEADVGLLELDGVPSTVEKPPASAEEILAESKREEVAEGERMRELATYGGERTATIAYPDGSEYADVCDLYVVLPQTLANGSVNLECAKVEDLGQCLLRGKPLSTTQIGILRELLAKYKTQIAALHAQEAKGGQDYAADTSELAASGRIVDPGTGGDTGLGGRVAA